MSPADDRALHGPAAARNAGPILDVLKQAIRPDACVLEIASGTGEHAVQFCQALPLVRWQPTDYDQEALSSIAAWGAQAGLASLLPPLMLDAASPGQWPAIRIDAVVAINMIHIAPWAATRGLLRGAAAVLRQGGVLFLYGAFREAGLELAESNRAFDADLRERNPAWGLREVGVIAAEAEQAGLQMVQRVDMPARNLVVLFRKQHGPE